MSSGTNKISISITKYDWNRDEVVNGFSKIVLIPTENKV